MSKTKSKDNLESTIDFLKKEIKTRKDILSDSFLKSNMYGFELGMFEIELGIYKKILKRLQK
jgi:hypothetical protein